MKKTLLLILVSFTLLGCNRGITQIESVTLDKTSVTMKIAASVDLLATFTPSEAINDLMWSSNNTKVVTVSSDGKVTGISEGVAKVKVYSKSNPNASSTCAIKVVDKILVESIAFNQDTYHVEHGSTLDLSKEIVIMPSDASDKNVVWMSADETIATINANGVLTTIMPGKVEIYATAHDASYATSNTQIIVDDTPDTGKGVAITRCNTTYGLWTSATRDCVLEMDNTDFKTGTGCVKANIYNTGKYDGEDGQFANSFIFCYTPDKGEEINCSSVWNNGRLLVTLYVSDASVFNRGVSDPWGVEDGAIEIGSGGTMDEYELNWNITSWRGRLTNGWNNIELKISDGDYTFGEPDPSKINWFRLFYTCLRSGDVIKLDQVRIYNN